MNILPKLSLLATMGFFASPAFSQTPIGPFTGSVSEPFDEFPPQDVQLFLPLPVSAFGGNGMIDVLLGPGGCCGLAVYDPPLHPFGNYQPFDGDKFAVTQDFGDTMVFEFFSAMRNFGAYWGADALHVVFRDANDVTVGSGDYSPEVSNDGTLKWLGWNLATPFTSVAVSDVTPDHIFVLDSVQASVPEPQTWASLATGCVALLGFRRRSKARA